MWVTVEPGIVHKGRFEASQFGATCAVWRWQVGDSMAGGAQHSGIALTHDDAWQEAMAAVERAKIGGALAQARAEGEAAGREAERAAVVAYLRLAAEAHCSLALHEEAGHVESGHHNAAPE